MPPLHVGMLALDDGLSLHISALVSPQRGRESVAQGGAGFAEPWVGEERRRAREAGERQYRAGAVSAARFAGLLSFSGNPRVSQKALHPGPHSTAASRAEMSKLQGKVFNLPGSDFDGETGRLKTCPTDSC